METLCLKHKMDIDVLQFDILDIYPGMQALAILHWKMNSWADSLLISLYELGVSFALQRLD